jgi:hypothetical protein
MGWHSDSLSRCGADVSQAVFFWTALQCLSQVRPVWRSWQAVALSLRERAFENLSDGDMRLCGGQAPAENSLIDRDLKTAIGRFSDLRFQ